MVSRKIRTPYTTLLVLVGLALSAVPGSIFSGIVSVFNGLVNGGLFIGLVLPPILFESIMSVKYSDFRAVYRPAVLLATVGVVISTLVVGVGLWKVVGIDPVASFFFAALISPTDVATVLEIFARVDVPSRLATLVEMESVFNDATGIAIFSIVVAAASEVTLKPFVALLSFTYVLGGGVLVGLAVSWGARQLQRHVEDSVTQVVLTLVTVYGAYGLANVLEASGLIAVAMTGLFYGNSMMLHYGSTRAAQTTSEFWKVFAFVANAVAFFFIGVSTNIFLIATGVVAILAAYGVVMMARMISVYPILSLTKVGESFMPASWMNIGVLGGMRGALAIVLVSVVPPDTRPQVATLAFGVVMLSILLQGPLLSRFSRGRFGGQQTLAEATEEERPKKESDSQLLSTEPEGGEPDAVR